MRYKSSATQRAGRPAGSELRPRALAPARALGPALTLAALAALAASGCPGEGTVGRPSCSKIPDCDSPCCDKDRECVEIICEGVSWVCRSEGADHLWKRDAVCPPPDLGPDGPPSDGSLRCGINARQNSAGACVCVQGYLDKDGQWSTGCEAKNPACSVTSCGHCPVGYCGKNAHCRDNLKCRCIDRFWLNKDDDWSNGCEAYTSDCAPNNCNSCYVGFCGPHADCMQSVCKCVATGWFDCDKKWELSGCECQVGCNGSACK